MKPWYYEGCAHIHHPTPGSAYMLFAGWEVHMVKAQGHIVMGFLKRTNLKPAYGPTLSRQITCLFFSCSKLALQITNGFVYVALVIQWACAPLPTISKKSWQWMSNSDTCSKQKKDVLKIRLFQTTLC